MCIIIKAFDAYYFYEPQKKEEYIIQQYNGKKCVSMCTELATK